MSAISSLPPRPPLRPPSPGQSAMPLRSAMARPDADPQADALARAGGPTREDAFRLAQDVRLARTAGLDRRKAQARERLTQLVEQIRLIKRLWAGDPRRTAQEIARIARELKAVLRDYAAAAKASGEAVAPPANAAACLAFCSPAAAAPAGEPARPDAAMSQEEMARDRAAQAAAHAYARPQAAPAARDPSERAAQNEADRVFVGQAREVFKVLRDWLDEARIKAQGALRIRTRSDAPPQDASFRDAAEEMARTSRALRLLEADIRRETPPPASLSVAQA